MALMFIVPVWGIDLTRKGDCQGTIKSFLKFPRLCAHLYAGAHIADSEDTNQHTRREQAGQ
jgi:hypothetical protein